MSMFDDIVFEESMMLNEEFHNKREYYKQKQAQMKQARKEEKDRTNRAIRKNNDVEVNHRDKSRAAEMRAYDKAQGMSDSIERAYAGDAAARRARRHGPKTESALTLLADYEPEYNY